MTVPTKLYKYESFNTQSLSNLKNSSVYFSLPTQFNDPFDCALPISLDLSLDSIESFTTEFIKRGNLPELTFDYKNFSFTKPTATEWIESNTIKYKGKTVLELQLHTLKVA